ncbi:MAG: YfdX family protein [Gallionella sp.]
MKQAHHFALCLLSSSLLFSSPVVFASIKAAQTTATISVPTQVASNTRKQAKNIARREINKHHKSLVKEAIVAHNDMLQAVFFLDKNDTKNAFKKLKDADDKLGVLLARNQQLKMAAIDVRTNINDLDVSPNDIEKVVGKAKSALNDGKIQAARAMLTTLSSEMDIYTDYLPLETYPDVIKMATKKIKAHKIKAAEIILADALDSIVTVEKVMPLPPIKAEGDVIEAEQLFKHNKVKNKDMIQRLLKDADNHLLNAKELGYGEYKGIRTEISAIQSKVDSDTSKPDLFERIKNLFHKSPSQKTKAS